MKIYIINPKADFTAQQIEAMNNQGDVIFIEGENVDINSQAYLNDPEEKILALSPETIQWNFTNDVLEKIQNIRAICLATTGFSWVDGEYCRNKGIKLTNVPHYSTDAVAEYATFLMLSLTRKIPMQIKSNFKCKYSPEMLQGEVKGKIAGIIGLGHIGKRIAEICQGLGMNVVYWSRNKKDDPFEYMELKDLISQSDFVFVSLSKNSETQNLLNKELLKNMKESSNFISIGDIEDRKYLIEQVEKGNLSGLAFEAEGENIMNFKGNIMVTAPYAWYTNEAMKNNMEIWTNTIISACQNKPMNIVNW